MNSAPTQVAASGRLSIYEPNHQISMWSDSFKADSSQNTSASTIVEGEVKLSDKVRKLEIYCVA